MTEPKPILDRMFSLKGRTGIVTGASGGLGLAMAETLASVGASVYGLSRSGAKGESAAPAGLKQLRVDVTDRTALEDAIGMIGAKGPIDFLVNNAGITERCRFESSSSADWQRIQEVNVESAARLCQLAYPHLQGSSHPGRILFISSMAAHLGFSEVVPYCVSKSALLGLMRGLAVEWAPDGILVNSIAPGWFPSEMTRKVMDPDREQKILNRMPMRRFGRPEELAAAVLFLLSPAATYITGHDLAIDGGALAFGF